MPVDAMLAAQIALSTLNAFANILRLWRSHKDGGLDELKRATEKAELVLPSIEDVRTLAHKIPKDILDVIGKTLADAQDRFKKALGDPANTRQAKDQEEKVAASTICGELERIKRLNNGTLPTETLEDLWATFGC